MSRDITLPQIPQITPENTVAALRAMKEIIEKMIVGRGRSGAYMQINGDSDNAIKGWDAAGVLRCTITPTWMSIVAPATQNAVYGQSGTGAGVRGHATDNGKGVYGTSVGGAGVRGESTSTAGGVGIGVEGRSASYFGGAFYGGANGSSETAPLYINPNSTLPAAGASNGSIYGAIAAQDNKLWFHNGTAWKEVQFV